jgi:uncharacterized membrane protein
MKVSTAQIVRAAILGALYAVFTIVIAPLSYGPIQFRVSEIFKVFVLFDPVYALGIGIGTFFGNLASPFVGPWELVFMPLTDIAGGAIAYILYRWMGKRYALVALSVYAITTSFSVGLMLTFYGAGSIWLLAGLVVISELVILIGGYPVIMWIVQVLKQRGIYLEG